MDRKWPVLELLYPESDLCFLQEWLQARNHRNLVWPGDPSEYKTFLETSVLACARSQMPSSAVRSQYPATQALSGSFYPGGVNIDNLHPRLAWQLLLSRIGYEAVRYLVKNTTVFLQIESSNFIQLTGLPVYKLLRLQKQPSNQKPNEAEVKTRPRHCDRRKQKYVRKGRERNKNSLRESRGKSTAGKLRTNMAAENADISSSYVQKPFSSDVAQWTRIRSFADDAALKARTGSETPRSSSMRHFGTDRVMPLQSEGPGDANLSDSSPPVPVRLARKRKGAENTSEHSPCRKKCKRRSWETPPPESAGKFSVRRCQSKPVGTDNSQSICLFSPGEALPCSAKSNPVIQESGEVNLQAVPRAFTCSRPPDCHDEFPPHEEVEDGTDSLGMCESSETRAPDRHPLAEMDSLSGPGAAEDGGTTKTLVDVLDGVASSLNRPLSEENHVRCEPRMRKRRRKAKQKEEVPPLPADFQPYQYHKELPRKKMLCTYYLGEKFHPSYMLSNRHLSIQESADQLYEAVFTNAKVTKSGNLSPCCCRGCLGDRGCKCSRNQTSEILPGEPTATASSAVGSVDCARDKMEASRRRDDNGSRNLPEKVHRCCCKSRLLPLLEELVSRHRSFHFPTAVNYFCHVKPLSHKKCHHQIRFDSQTQVGFKRKGGKHVGLDVASAMGSETQTVWNSQMDKSPSSRNTQCVPTNKSSSASTSLQVSSLSENSGKICETEKNEREAKVSGENSVIPSPLKTHYAVHKKSGKDHRKRCSKNPTLFRQWKCYKCLWKRKWSLSHLLESFTAHRQVFLFLRMVVLAVVPEGLFGSRHNRNVFLKRIRELVSMGKYDRLCLGRLMNGVKLKPCDWLTCVRGNSGKTLLMAKLLWWLMADFIMRVISTFFYLTETTVYRNRLFYYRKCVWRHIVRRGVEAYTKQSCLAPCSQTRVQDMLASGESLGVTQLRFLPKHNSLRPILNLGARQKSSLTNMSINRRLQDLYDVLKHLCRSRPELLGASVFGLDDVYKRWSEFVQQFRKRECSSPWPFLYFVKVDILRCFDSIKLHHLEEIVEKVLEMDRQDCYTVQHFASVHKSSDRLRQIFHRSVHPGSLPSTDFADLIADLVKEKAWHHRIFVNQQWECSVSREKLLKLLHSHLHGNIVKVGSRYYLQRQGLSQGSVVSTLLCNLYYAVVEKQLIQLRPGELLMRMVDDFLLVTPSRKHASAFLDSLLLGNPAFGCFSNPEKVLVNFDLNDLEWSDIPRVKDAELFPWCGLLFDTWTLEVRRDYSTYMGVTMADTMTFHLGHQAGQRLRRSLVMSLRSRCHGVFVDPGINSPATAVYNVVQTFLLLAAKFRCYIWRLPMSQSVESNPLFLMRVILFLADYYRSSLLKKCRVYRTQTPPEVSEPHILKPSPALPGSGTSYQTPVRQDTGASYQTPVLQDTGTSYQTPAPSSIGSIQQTTPQPGLGSVQQPVLHPCLGSVQQPVPPSGLDSVQQPVPPSGLDSVQQPVPPSGLDSVQQPVPPSGLDSIQQPVPPSGLDSIQQPVPPSGLDSIQQPVLHPCLGSVQQPVPPSGLDSVQQPVPPSGLGSVQQPVSLPGVDSVQQALSPPGLGSVQQTRWLCLQAFLLALHPCPNRSRLPCPSLLALMKRRIRSLGRELSSAGVDLQWLLSIVRDANTDELDGLQ